jgi:hypothetical protein
LEKSEKLAKLYLIILLNIFSLVKIRRNTISIKLIILLNILSLVKIRKNTISIKLIE